MINENIEHAIIDQLEESVTPEKGGDDRKDWKGLVAKFVYCQSHENDGTTVYSDEN